MDLDKEELEATKRKQGMKVKIQLEEIETHRLSNYIDVEDIIRRPDEVEWEFKLNDVDYETLPYHDFIFFQSQYKLHYLVEE